MSRRKQNENGSVFSVRQAAAACNVTPPVVRRWLSLGLLSEPPWTLDQLHEVRDRTDPQGRRRGPQTAHGTLISDCELCRQAQNDSARARGRRKAQTRLPAATRQRLLDAIYNGKLFRESLHDLGLTPNQVWGLTKTAEEWSTAIEAALTATRRSDLKHGTNAAYVAGCVCKECRAYQSIRMGRRRD